MSHSTVIMIPHACLFRSTKTTDPEELSEETFSRGRGGMGICDGKKKKRKTRNERKTSEEVE